MTGTLKWRYNFRREILLWGGTASIKD